MWVIYGYNVEKTIKSTESDLLRDKVLNTISNLYSYQKYVRTNKTINWITPKTLAQNESGTLSK